MLPRPFAFVLRVSYGAIVPITTTLEDAVPDETVDVLTELRRPFMPAAVKWKIQTEWGSGAIVVAHIDARLVIERLNLVVGTDWTDDYQPLGERAMWCKLTVNGQSHKDVGLGSDEKAKVSDALKRAAVHFGIGVSVYALAAVRMEVGTGPSKLRTERRKKKQRDGSFKEVNVCVLDAANLEKLADSYAKWLEGKGAMFGEPYEHGDQVGAQGLELDVEPEQEVVSAEPRGLNLGPAVDAVLKRAAELGHAGLADRATAEVELEGQPEDFIADWVECANVELDAIPVDGDDT